MRRPAPVLAEFRDVHLRSFASSDLWAVHALHRSKWLWIGVVALPAAGGVLVGPRPHGRLCSMPPL